MFGRTKAIEYNVVPTSTGWQIQAVLTPDVSPEDRIKVIDWFHSYRSNVSHMNPLWLTSFTAGKEGYALDIYPASTPQQMLGNAVQRALQLELFDDYGEPGNRRGLPEETAPGIQ